MSISEEFNRFCNRFVQHFDTLYGPEPEDWIKGALRVVNKERSAILRNDLIELLSDKYSNEQMEEVYYSTFTELIFRDVRELRQFLEMVRDSIDADSS
ncbi:MAG: hypothetical protein Dbin4_03065 [Alphaproteobacteria bacterium]|nr:hypothetical protein [Alphaproteobacteria bacterium]